jgi:hypothetical protein
MTDNVVTLKTKNDKTKLECLQHYTDREPKKFVQLDCWACDGWDDVIRPDGDGHGLTGGVTTELMHGSTVRILILPDTKPAEVAAMLRKAADWVERGAIACCLGDEGELNPFDLDGFDGGQR